MKFLKRKKSFEIEELDITSLLDVLVILLVFLLQNMANSELSLDLVNDLSLPITESRGVSEPGFILQVNAEKEIYVNNKYIDSIRSPKVIPRKLFKFLKDEKQRQLKNTTKEEGLMINLVLDKSIDYKTIDFLLKSVASSGFTQFKFIVQGVE